MLEVYHNASNQQEFVEINREYNISNSGIPEIFIGNNALVGETEIRDHFEVRILAEKERVASCNMTATGPSSSAENCTTAATSLTPRMVIIPALVDSLNPCALSVLIFLLISIAAAENRKRILLIGGSYIAAVFLFHLLMGIGIFSVVSLSGYSKLFSLLGATIAVVLGVITLGDVIKNKETFLLSVPAAGKGILSALYPDRVPARCLYSRHTCRAARLLLYRGDLYQHTRPHGERADPHDRFPVPHPV